MKNPYPWYAPRMWHGMPAGELWPLLARNARSISPGGIGLAVTSALAAPANSLLGLASEAIYRGRVKHAEVKSPVFVLGHWRSGTTLLHELLALDPQFTFPTSYQCLTPHHFLISQSWLAPVMQLVSPKHRPMDSMPLHVSLPQEDEFALALLGVRSPYLAWGFPGAYQDWPEMLDSESFSPQDRQAWQQALEGFARRVSVSMPKRIVFKSPPHTARVKAIREVFPDARFVHILRDPYEVFASTVRTWRATTQSQWFQTTDFADLEEQVFNAFVKLYTAYQRDRVEIPSGHLHEVRFEQLLSNPIDQLQQVYEDLDLGGFEAVRPNLEGYFADRKSYRKHEYNRDFELEARINDRWGRFIKEFGYERKTP